MEEIRQFTKLGEGTFWGHGACGDVYRVDSEKHGPLAVKVYHEGAVNVGLIDERYKKVKRVKAKEGIVPIVAYEKAGEEIFVAVPFYEDHSEGDEGAGGEFIEASLQMRLARYFDSAESWEVIAEIARAMASLHLRGVVHGNLKPGNIFFDEQERVMLSDYGEGTLMGGVECEYFSDAMLYASVEQISYEGERLPDEAFSWDVHAFGVLAYRLLTRLFPRCSATFISAAPRPGVSRRSGVKVAKEKIVQDLEKSQILPWPDFEMKSEWEEEARILILQCIDSDPERRPKDMTEVFEKLSAIQGEEALVVSDAEEKGAGLDARGRYDLFRNLVLVALMGLLGAGALFWVEENKVHQSLQAEHRKIQATLMMRSKELNSEKLNYQLKLEEQQAAAREATSELVGELSKGYSIDRADVVQASVLAELAALRKLTDRVIGLGLGTNTDYVPSLKKRKMWLDELENDLRIVLSETSKQPFAKDELVRMKLALAEVVIEQDNIAEAREILGEVKRYLIAEEAGPSKERTQARYAKVLVELALHWDDEVVTEDIAKARSALALLKVEEVGNNRWVMDASLNLLEARIIRKSGDAEKAMLSYQQVIDRLDQLSEGHPDARVMKYASAETALEATRLITGLEMTGQLIEMRAQAAKEYITILTKDPDDFEARSRLGAAYGTIAEASLEASDLEGAERYANAAISVAKQVLTNNPTDQRSLAVLGTQKGLLAVGHRERGEADEAEKLLREGVNELEVVLKIDPQNPEFLYRRSLLQWQLASVLSQFGQGSEGVTTGKEARDTLVTLLEKNYSYASEEQIQRTLSYLSGDLGLIAKNGGKNDTAVSFFKESETYWLSLKETRPDSLEYKEGLLWTKQRLKEFK